MKKIGIIGGSGLYDLDSLRCVTKLEIDTPFGRPSDALIKGELHGVEVVFLPRHGLGHRFLPSEVPYRANIFALKTLGVEWLISVSAVGSLREDIHPGEVVIPDQFVDRTNARPNTFFGEGLVAHVAMADPICSALSAFLAKMVAQTGLKCHSKGTYICIPGPTFSTRAESNLYRAWGMDIIGMTAMPEAKLAREAEMHYATLALVTDYDCWHQNEADVSVEAVVAILKQNVANVRQVLELAIPQIPSRAQNPKCGCANALNGAVLTSTQAIPKSRQDILAPLFKNSTST